MNSPLHARALALAEDVRQLGGRAFFVGGCVRDEILGLEPKDFDLEVFGLAPDAVEQLVSKHGKVHLVGKQFAVLLLDTPDGHLEVSLPRRESNTGPGHKGFAVSADPFMEPIEAARRRDFTVNALMRDPLSGELLDFYGAQEDIRRGVLRHVSDAFSEDPLRVFRACRFVSRFGWRVASETASLCQKIRVDELPLQRIEAEWEDILVRGQHPGQGLLALETCGALSLFHELAALRGVAQDPIWHPEGDVLHHTALCLDAAVSIRPLMENPFVEMLGVLCHDLGKTVTTIFERGRWRCPNHDHEGKGLTHALLAKMSPRVSLADEVAPLVREHMRPSQLWLNRENVGDSAIRKLSTRVSIPALARVAWADAAGCGSPLVGSSRSVPFEEWEPAQWLLNRANEIGVKDGQPDRFLLGRDLLKLGMTPGPAVGKVLSDAWDLQIEGVLDSREAALAWAAQRLA